MSKPTHITDFLAQHASATPDKPALVTDQESLTWHQLDAEVNRVSRQLAACLPSNDQQQVVALLLPNSTDLVVAYLAVVRSGHIAFPLDMGYKALELDAVVQALPPTLAIANQATRPRLGKLKATVLDISELRAGTTQEPTAAPYLRLPADQQIASLMFTSGTTGQPKASPYTHANHLWNIELSTKLWNWTGGDSLLISLPLSHWHGVVMGISGMLVHGNTMYLRPRFEATDTLRWLSSGKITIHQHVAVAYVKLAQHPQFANFDLSGVRLCTSASAALPPATWQAFKDHFGIEILECYGSAEAGRIASNTLDRRIPGTPGHIIPGVQAKLGPGGEVLVKTPGLFPGYYRNPKATAKAFADGDWWIMGDLGQFDDDGNLYIKGRLQERMKKQGYSVYPRDVEWAMQQHPSVEDVYVLGEHVEGSPNDRLVYFVVGKLDDEAILSYCKANMPSAWRPDRIIRVEAIPRTRTGKPRLPELQQLSRQHSGRLEKVS